MPLPVGKQFPLGWSEEARLQQLFNMGYESTDDILVEILEVQGPPNRIRWLQQSYALLENYEKQQP